MTDHAAVATHLRRFSQCAAVLSLLVIAACSDSTAPGEINDRPRSPAWDVVSVSNSNSCALTEAGELYCWGFGVENPCIIGYACSMSPRPTAMPGTPMRFDTIAGRGNYHCGISVARDAYCWGDFDAGSLGDGTTRQSLVPVRVAVDDPVHMVSPGTRHACILTEEMVAYCWGNSDGGKLGLGDYDPVFLPTPTRVVTELRFKSISAGSTQTCAITIDNKAYCWGGLYGTLGVGQDLDNTCFEGESYSCLTSGTPLLVAGDHRWLSISAGNGFTCGVTHDNRGYCWGAVPEYGAQGERFGVLGNGTLEGSKAPVPVDGGHEFTRIYTGLASACGLTTRGVAYCWGLNGRGTLGIGTHGSIIQDGGDDAELRKPSPVRVSGGLRFTSLAMWEQVCAVSTNNNLYCWGDNFGGKLGTAKADQEILTVPTPVLRPET